MSHKEEEADMIVDSLDELFPEEETADFDASIQPKGETPNSQGGNMGVKVFDGNGDRKHEVEYLRVPEMGSVEAYLLDNGKWAVTRRDKLPHR